MKANVVNGKIKIRKVGKRQAKRIEVERIEAEALKRKLAKRKQAIASLTESERQAITKAGLKIERSKRKASFTKAEIATLELASEIGKGKLSTNLRVTLRQIAKRFCSTITESVKRSERKAKADILPMEYIPLSEESGLFGDDFTLQYVKRYRKPNKVAIDKLSESEFRQAVDNTVIDLESLPSEIKTYLAIAYIMSCRVNRKIWHDREDCFQSVMASILSVANNGKTEASLVSENRLLDIGFKPTLSESQAYVIGKRRLVDYWREVYKRSKELSLDSYVGDDSILSLPSQDFESVINKRGNSWTGMLSESVVSKNKLSEIGFNQANMLGQSENWNREVEADLFLIKAKAEAKAESGKLRTERQAVRIALKDMTEYSRITEAEADIVATLHNIKDKRFKRIFIEVKNHETSKLSEVLVEKDYEYMKRYLRKYPLIETRLKSDIQALKRAKLGEAEIAV